MAGITNIKPISITESKLPLLPISEGQLIFVTDARKIYLDKKGVRTCYSDSGIMSLIDEDHRLALTNPMEGFYYVKTTQSLWRYDTKWIPLTDSSSRENIVFSENGQLPTIGVENTLYVKDNDLYRWNGEDYVRLGTATSPIWEEI